MNQAKRFLDPEKAKRTVERLREANRQLEILDLKLEELNAIVEADLRRQRLERIERRKKQTVISESKE